MRQFFRLATFLLLMLPAALLWADGLPPIETLNSESDQTNWEHAVSETIIIEAPLEMVWDYISDSTSAKEWSVFFDHISPLPGVQDGEVGSLRRCYRNANEKGFTWDEVTTAIEFQKMRQITTFRVRSRPWGFTTKDGYVFVRQLYKKIDENRTELTFQTVSPAQAQWLHRQIFNLSRKETRRIFQKNLINIKAVLEGHLRVFLWE